MAKSIHFELCDILTDSQGRYVFLRVKLYGEPFLLLACYIPPPFCTEVITEGFAFMSHFPSIPAVWLGDFNNVLDPSLDRTRVGTSPSGHMHQTRFSKLMSTFNLIDTWRYKYPKGLAYSCFSSTHNSLSRIDFIMISHILASRLKEVAFCPRLLSDHSPYWITISTSTTRPPRAWRLNPFWLSLLPEDDILVNTWKQYFLENERSASPSVVWEMFKVHVRATMISSINKLKADSAAAIDKAMAELSSSEHAYAQNPKPALAAALLKLQTRVVNQLQYGKARQRLFFSRQKLFEHGERAGKLLAYLVHSDDRPPVVISLHGDDGILLTDPPEVTAKFRDFFAELYTSRTPNERDSMNHFLENIPFPRLTEDQISMLDAPLTTDEIAEALAGFTRSKSPGSDGLPVEFYLQYSELLIPKLLALYNYALETFELPPSLREATIVLIPKPDKDPRYPASYRPISLLQVDIKVLAKVLANHIKQIILSLIHTDQAGFMPGRNTSFNLRRLYINLQALHDRAGSRVIVALDTAKAFDSVEWRYLWKCLECYGFGPKIIKWIQLLYQDPQAKVVANGWPSPVFGLSRGTRQGCPLSPLLYALAAEPLAISIRENPEIRGLGVGDLIEKKSECMLMTLCYT